MIEGPPTCPPAVRHALPAALGLGALTAWLAALETAWNRWNALAAGPICGDAGGWLSLPSHCPACPLALILTTGFIAVMMDRRRAPALARRRR